MKKVEWLNKNKMKIETGLKVFDQQTNLISHGNVISNTQYSAYIRSFKETKNPVGEKVKEGQLRDFDLKNFQGLPSGVRKYVEEATKSKKVILYEFRHFNGQTKVVHGYVVTDEKHNLLKQFVTGKTEKSAKVIEECAKYVAHGLE